MQLVAEVLRVLAPLCFCFFWYTLVSLGCSPGRLPYCPRDKNASELWAVAGDSIWVWAQGKASLDLWSELLALRRWGEGVPESLVLGIRAVLEFSRETKTTESVSLSVCLSLCFFFSLSLSLYIYIYVFIP